MTSRLVSGPLCFTNIKIVSTSIHSSSTVGLDDRRRVVRLCVNTYCFVILQVRILNYWKEVTRCWSQHSLGPKRDQDGDQDGVYVYGTKTGPEADSRVQMLKFPTRKYTKSINIHEIDRYITRNCIPGVWKTGFTERDMFLRPPRGGQETKRLVIGRRGQQLTISIFV